MTTEISSLLENILLDKKKLFWSQKQTWAPVSNQEFIAFVESWAHYFKEAGIKKGDVVVLCLANSWKWLAIELSLQLNRAIVMGLEKSFIEKNGTFVNRQINPSLIIVDKENATLQKINTNHNLHFENLDKPKNTSSSLTPTFKEYITDDSDEAVMICTSGTTGLPKLITYTHEQISLSVEGICKTFSNCKANEKIISWLPLSHLFQRIVNRSILKIKGQIYFINNPKEAMGQMKIVKPTIWIGVPKFYESVQHEIENKTKTMLPAKKELFASAIKHNQMHYEAKREKENLSLKATSIRFLLNQIALKRIKALTGGQVKLWISGSAPLKPATAAFWEGLNLPILQAYGVSECIIPIAMNTPATHKNGSVGKPLDNVKIKISPSSEIYISSPGLCISTEKKVFDNENYYNTGDLGSLDPDGFLFINGRKSEIIKMANGRKVFPAPIEAKLCAFTEIDQAFVSGHGRNCLIALIYGISENLTQAKIQKIVNEVNQSLEKHENIKLFKVISKPFSIENDELTSNFKIRRHVIEKKYEEFLNATEEQEFITTSILLGV